MQNKQTGGRHDWKLSYITNNESRIFIQEEVNFIPILFTWLGVYYIKRRNESHFLHDSTYIRGIINFLLVNDLFGIDPFQSEVFYCFFCIF